MHAHNFKAKSCNSRAVQQLWNGKKETGKGDDVMFWSAIFGISNCGT